MKMISLNVLSEASNHAVVQMPGRNFPGCVIQGDSLAALCSEAKEISERLKLACCSDEDLLYLAQEHQENLLERLIHYQTVLAEHQMSLPYSSSAAPGDLVVLVPEDDEHAS